MKFNKWTLGLAAIGAVSLASAARADEAKITPLQTSLSNTTISGYVDVAAQYNPGNQNVESIVPAGTGQSKINQFSLNTLDVTIDKPQDESPWASGYHFDLNFGEDSINPTSAGSNIGIRQAYVVLRTPVGNGIDWKFGVQDDIIGYEGNTDGANPNYTRSIGYNIEPTTLTGLIGTYKFCDMVSVSGGVANATDGINSISSKTLAAAVALTAPDSWGFLKGATANVGTLLNFEKEGQDNFYAGVVVPTPYSKLKVGSSFDLVSLNNKSNFNSKNDSGWVVGVYGNFQATDKLSLNLRGEYFDLAEGIAGGAYNPDFAFDTNGRGEEVTATVAYNLWANVTSRAEFRWDHVDSGNAFAAGDVANSYILALNIIYTF
jgi:hypothetical protein